jgi:hypothetical protein
MSFDYKTLPIKNKAVDSPNEIRGFSERRKTVTRKFKKNRRKPHLDRRKSVRDGVIVVLSFKQNRRKGIDRRKISSNAVFAL